MTKTTLFNTFTFIGWYERQTCKKVIKIQKNRSIVGMKTNSVIYKAQEYKTCNFLNFSVAKLICILSPTLIYSQIQSILGNKSIPIFLN